MILQPEPHRRAVGRVVHVETLYEVLVCAERLRQPHAAPRGLLDLDLVRLEVVQLAEPSVDARVDGAEAWPGGGLSRRI